MTTLQLLMAIELMRWNFVCHSRRKVESSIFRAKMSWREKRLGTENCATLISRGAKPRGVALAPAFGNGQSGERPIPDLGVAKV